MARHRPRARASCTRRSCRTPKGAERAIAAGGRRDRARRERERDAQPEERAPVGRRVARRRARRRRDRARRRHRGRGDRVDRVRLPVRRRRRARAGRAARRATWSTRAPTGCRSATPPAWPRRAASTTCSTRSTAPGSTRDRVGLHFHNTRGTALANVRRRARAGRDALRRVDRRARRLPVRAGRVGQRGDRGSRAHAATTWGSRPASISTRCSRARALAQEIVGRELPSALLHAGPRTRTVRVVSDARRVRAARRAHASARAQGNLAKEAEKLAEQNKLFVRDRLALLLDDDSFVEDGAARERARRRPSRRRRGHRRRPHRRPPGVRDGERPDGEGRLVGRAHGREDRAAHRARAAARAAGRVPRRLRRRAHHRPGRAVPRPARRGPHLRQPGAAVGQGAAGVLPVRPVGRGRRVHPRVLRRRCSWSRATRRCTSARRAWPRS